MKKDPVLKTKHLRIAPLSVESFEALVARDELDEEQTVFEELLSEFHTDPENRLWYTPLALWLKKEGTPVGYIYPMGTPEHKTVRIGILIFSDHEYASEAIQSYTAQLLADEQVGFVEFFAPMDLPAARKAAEKAGYLPYHDEENGTRYVRQQDGSAWFAIYMSLGISCGMCIGSPSGNYGVSMCIGMCIGLCLGMALDSSHKKKLAELRKEWESYRDCSFPKEPEKENKKKKR